jgi:ribosomal biogenesis protein LAS1
MPILYGLVSADLLPAPRNGVEAQSTRLSCAMAIVRLVNGMVDPLQTGTSIYTFWRLHQTLRFSTTDGVSVRDEAMEHDGGRGPIQQAKRG